MIDARSREYDEEVTRQTPEGACIKSPACLAPSFRPDEAKLGEVRPTRCCIRRASHDAV